MYNVCMYLCVYTCDIEVASNYMSHYFVSTHTYFTTSSEPKVDNGGHT